jgi:uncharacterized protein with FMN-binding domain
MEPENNSTSSIIKKVALGVLSVAVIASVGVYLSQDKNKKEEAKEEVAQEETPITPPTPTPSVTTETKSNENQKVTSLLKYKDGTYQATGSYTSPAGQEKVAISLTVVNDAVTQAAFIGEATHPASKKWQAEFSKGFDTAVMGKKIDELNLSIVNGSSLTPKGFMDALQTIKTDAQL